MGAGFHRAHRFYTELARRQCFGVAVEDHNVSGERGAVFKPHPARLAALHQYLTDVCIEMQVYAELACKLRHHGG